MRREGRSAFAKSICRWRWLGGPAGLLGSDGRARRVGDSRTAALANVNERAFPMAEEKWSVAEAFASFAAAIQSV
jgi:hypothetical protein